MKADRTTTVTTPVAQLRDVTKRFGETVAVDRLDLDVPTGQITGLLGPNGAGKSTVIGLLAGLRRADSGQVRLFGGTPRDAGMRLRLGMTPQETGLPSTLRVSEALAFVSRHFPDPLDASWLLERFDLEHVAQRQTGGLSGGQRRRLAVALAFVGKPRLVILDEPTTGLDVEGRHTLWDVIREYADDGGTVLLSSHYLEEVENLAQQIVVMRRGRVVASGETARVRGQVVRSKVSYRGPRPPSLASTTAIEAVGNRQIVHTADADELIRVLVSHHIPFADLQVVGASLEDAFLTLTADSKSADAHRSAVGGPR
jgi:ABC-2 type transport system ATP-binding protein